MVSRNASTINGALASGSDVGIFYGTTNPAAAGLVISPRGIGSGIKMDIAGNVGINTSTPRFTFDVSGIIGINNNVNNKKLVLYETTSEANPTTATNFYGFGINSGALRYQVDTNSSTHIFYGGTTEYMRIGGSRVGINNNNPTVALDVVGNIKASANITASTLNLSGAITGATATNTINGVIINNGAVSGVTTLNLSGAITGATSLTSTGDIRSHTKVICRANNTNTGYCELTPGSTTNPGYIAFFKPAGGAAGYIGWQGTTSGYLAMQVDNTSYFGYEVTGIMRATAFNLTSDYRMKKNLQPISRHRSIDLLNPVEYDLSGGSHDMGFLAHEVQEIFPFLVSGEKDGENMQSMNYNGFIALLVKEVQNLKKENRELMKMKVLQEQQQTQITYLQEQIKILLSR